MTAKGSIRLVANAVESESEREIAEAVVKELNAQKGSKYIKPSYGSGGGSYNVSRNIKP